jgi:hypothetical protein
LRSFSSEFLRQARLVLKEAPPLAEKVRDGFPLNEAYEVAITAKLEDQREHVRWWDATVRDPGQPEKNSRTNALILSEAEVVAETGIDHRVVSRWRAGMRGGGCGRHGPPGSSCATPGLQRHPIGPLAQGAVPERCHGPFIRERMAARG